MNKQQYIFWMSMLGRNNMEDENFHYKEKFFDGNPHDHLYNFLKFEKEEIIKIS